MKPTTSFSILLFGHTLLSWKTRPCQRGQHLGPAPVTVVKDQPVAIFWLGHPDILSFWDWYPWQVPKYNPKKWTSWYWVGTHPPCETADMHELLFNHISCTSKVCQLFDSTFVIRLPGMQKTIFFVGQNQKITPAIFSNKPWKIQTPSKKMLPYQKCPLFLPCQMRHRGNSLGAPSWLSGRSAKPSLDAENVSGRAPFQQLTTTNINNNNNNDNNNS